MSISTQTAAFTDKGLNPKTAVNEDSYLVAENRGVFVVADGVGGADAGDVASKTAVKTIEQIINREAPSENNIALAVEALITAANREIFAAGKKKNTHMASTIAMIAIAGNQAAVGHVGDSRVYVIRGGKITQLTKDHSKLQGWLDKFKGKKVDAAGFKGSHIITKALGVKEAVDADILNVKLKAGDLFFLCSDGVSRYYSEADLVAASSRFPKDLNKMLKAIRQKCYSEGAMDNLTAIAVKVVSI
ncbi:MAG: serine/threonine-protein phosphatase [Calditrichaeota bacterium]|nr:MAG: serine/threonine-protein phosphatase [Calditrichota bacterium]